MNAADREAARRADYVRRMSLPFDERDEATWGDQTPAGYEWREVSDGEAHLFAPDGRNLTMAIYAREAAQ